jgi:hypothetical protein
MVTRVGGKAGRPNRVPPPIPASSQQKEEIASSAVKEKPFRKIGKDTSPV